MTAELGQTTSRLLNRLAYDIANKAADITTATSSDLIPMVDVSDDYEIKYADAANVREMAGIGVDLTSLAATDAELNRVADVSTRVVTLVASGAVSLATHEHKTLLLGEVGGNALCAMTLPAATGSGAIYRFIVSVVNTSSYTITTNSTDVFNGTIITHDIDITDGTLLHALQPGDAVLVRPSGGRQSRCPPPSPRSFHAQGRIHAQGRSDARRVRETAETSG
jgi:hypothetical protein